MDSNTGIDVSLRLLHPNLYRAVMLLSGWFILLGLNFVIFTPTYLIFGMPNELWGSFFLLIGATEFFFLNVMNRLIMVQMALATGIPLCFILTIGTSEPFIHGVGSFQLPIMYLGLAVLQIPLALEAPVNPWTKAKR